MNFRPLGLLLSQETIEWRGKLKNTLHLRKHRRHLPERWTFGHLERLRPLRPAAGGRWTFGQGDTSTVVDSSQVRPRRRKCEKRNWEIRECYICIQFVTKLPHNIGEINEITGTDKLKIQSFDNELLIKLKIRAFKMPDIIWEEILPTGKLKKRAQSKILSHLENVMKAIEKRVQWT